MSDSNDDDYSSMNLSVMAAAAEQRISTAAAAAASAVAAPGDHDASSDASLSPGRRSKLVLPSLTPAMQEDLALTKELGTVKSLKPLSIGGRPEFADYPLQGIVAPHPNDVLCGRGGGSNNHPGNESFRELVNEVKVPYVNCPKREKPLIARRIVEAVRNQTPPGRFLCKDTKGLWNDIGDGRAREKTSQALREGAPIIRDMIRSPTDPTDVAAVVKEAKKAERAEKEYCVDVLEEEANPITAQASSHAPSKIEPTVVKCEIGPQVSMKNTPNLKKFLENAVPQSAAWPPIPQQAQRNFNLGMPYAHHARHMLGGFVAPPQVLLDYANRARYPDSVSIETVRRLLLGQIDPVTLALQLLSPQEAAMVARRHANSTVLMYPCPSVKMGDRSSSSGSSPTKHQLSNLTSIVSEGSSRTSLEECVVRKGTPSPSDGSSVESSKQSGSDTPSKRALPKKKRKYVEESGL
ncbi:hypothetical protein ACHAXA_011714 [Cyclostephanos tholiformis]|uniref:DUF6824 domain-containing protein n=1 Tax=Cyclostephanos tholiformis TaxID=382380 RepID=A0ABD3RZI5_9STRA